MHGDPPRTPFKQGEDVTLVGLTGYGQEADRGLSFEAGFDDHWVKPVDAARLKALVGRST